MSSNIAVSIKQLSKHYKLYRNPSERLLESMGLIRKPIPTYTALEDVSFEIPKGESFGIIGQNGAGKSTLLQLICKTLKPSAGHIETQGRVSALLELGAGFNPEFTGLENIYLNASILGLSRHEIDIKLQDIIDFSELAEFINHPVKTYSSGMFVRLAFSIAIMVEPDILVIDEALSVGDGAFAKKSFDKIMSLKGQGVTLIFCSHSLYQVEALCKQAIWLNKGQVAALGDTQTVITAYQGFLANRNQQHSQTVTHSSSNHDRVFIQRVELLASEVPQTAPTYRSGQDNLAIRILTHNPNHEPIVLAVTIHRLNDDCVCSFSSHIDRIDLSRPSSVTLEVPQLPLLKGQYYIDVFLMCDQGIHVYEHIKQAATFNVTQKHLEVGVVHIPRHWHLA